MGALEQQQVSLFEREEVLKKHQALLEDLGVLGKAYYEEDAPLVTDEVYDAKMLELKRLEREYPELLSVSSPTQVVGGKAKKGFEKYQHPVQMQSLQDVFDLEEVEGFVKGLSDEAQEDVLPTFVVEEKMDGLSVSLRYEKGRLISAATRGDGFLGEVVTENIKTIAEVPIVLDYPIPYLELRAEVYMTHKEFMRLNEDIDLRNQEKLLAVHEEDRASVKLEKRLANPRNAAAGSLRQLKPEVTAKRRLSICFFNIQAYEGLEAYFTSFDLNLHHEQLRLLKALGFPCVKSSLPLSSVEEVKAAILKIGEEREALPYDIDGAVVKVNEIALRKVLGETAKTPKWAVAYKYPSKRVMTKLQGIEIQVGRTGKLTPVAQLEPVLLQGSVIAKATLHNADYIAEKDIRVGDFVYIEKAGDVIPAVSEVVLEKREQSLPRFEMPLLCPSCAQAVQKREGEVAHFCMNALCPAKKMRLLEYAVSKAALDVKGLGPSILKTLEEKAFLTSLKDLFLLKDRKAELLALEGFQEKSVQNLLDEIETLKARPWASWLVSLGIEGIAQETAKLLAKHFESWRECAEASEADFKNLGGIGDKLSLNLKNFFSKQENVELLEQLEDLGILFLNPLYKKEASVEELKLKDRRIVITGSFKNYSREELSERLEALGAKILSSVSKNTDLLLCGEKAGSKLEKAKTLGIQILLEDDLEDWLNEL